MTITPVSNQCYGHGGFVHHWGTNKKGVIVEVRKFKVENSQDKEDGTHYTKVHIATFALKDIVSVLFENEGFHFGKIRAFSLKNKGLWAQVKGSNWNNQVPIESLSY